MNAEYYFKAQVEFDQQYYVERIDFQNWFRFYYLVKDVLRLKKKVVLEVGVGSGIVRSILLPHVQEYKVFDISPNLSPDYVGNICENLPTLNQKFDCIIAADVLEHLPFSELPAAVANIKSYLMPGGRALVTIPHRQSNFLFMSPKLIPRVITVTTGWLSIGAFYRRFIKRKIWIDPSHFWEIGDGNIKVKDVESVFLEAGFKIEKFSKLLYVDYWILEK